MSYIIFTSPRTGSTEFIKRLILQKRGPVNIRNRPGAPTFIDLIEFFNPPCTGAFGDLVHLFYNPDLYNKPINTLTLKDNITTAPYKWLHLIGNSSTFLNTVSMTFATREEVEQFIRNETDRRLDFITNLKDEYFVKQFVGLYDLDHIPGQLLALENAHKIFYYRKNIIDTILSNLIKSYYFDKPNAITKQNIDAHNWGGKLEPVIPKDITLDESRIASEFKGYIDLLIFFKANKSKFDSITCYEDAFKDRKSVV